MNTDNNYRHNTLSYKPDHKILPISEKQSYSIFNIVMSLIKNDSVSNAIVDCTDHRIHVRDYSWYSKLSRHDCYNNTLPYISDSAKSLYRICTWHNRG